MNESNLVSMDGDKRNFLKLCICLCLDSKLARRCKLAAAVIMPCAPTFVCGYAYGFMSLWVLLVIVMSVGEVEVGATKLSIINGT